MLLRPVRPQPLDEMTLPVEATRQVTMTSETYQPFSAADPTTTGVIVGGGGNDGASSLPDDGDEFPNSPGAVTTINPCLSGGAIEVFLEPKLPAARVLVVGTTPIAEALTALGGPWRFSQSRIRRLICR